MPDKPKAIFLLFDRDKAYSEADQARASGLVDIHGQAFTRETAMRHPAVLAETRFVLSSWGMHPLDEEFLAAAPNLEAIFYAAGSIRSFMTEAGWDRGIRVSSAWNANAIPVAEYSFAQVLLGLKRAQWSARRMAGGGTREEYPQWEIRGAYRSRVGLVGLGAIGRLVLKWISHTELRPVVYDPFLSDADAAALGVEKASLEHLFESCDAVSLHAPLIDSTRGMITGGLLRRMKPESFFLNTARGGLVVMDDLVAVLRERPDLFAVLDVTDPDEPIPVDHPLRALPNVQLTPHIAGAMGHEVFRMGAWMVDELARYLAGEPLKYEITREASANMA